MKSLKQKHGDYNQIHDPSDSIHLVKDTSTLNLRTQTSLLVVWDLSFIVSEFSLSSL